MFWDQRPGEWPRVQAALKRELPDLAEYADKASSVNEFNRLVDNHYIQLAITNERRSNRKRRLAYRRKIRPARVT